MSPHALIFTLLGHGPRVASMLSTISFGVALVLVLLHL